MHAHHKNLLRDFWLISPGKTPTGKTSQREERFLLFFSNVQDRKIVGKYNLSPPANFISKSGKMCSANPAVHPSFLPEFNAAVQPRKSYQQNNKCTVQQQNRPYLPRNSCPELADRTAGRTSIFVLKFIDVRTAFNAGRTHPQNLNFCAENLMQTVQHLMSHTIPRFLCNQCSRTAFNEAVLFLELCA